MLLRMLMTNSGSALDKIYTEFKKSLNSLKLKINVNKSKVMLFYEGLYKYEYSNLVLDDDEFEIVREFKYLGNVLTYNLGDDMDVKLKLNNFYSSFHSIFRCFNGINFESFYIFLIQFVLHNMVFPCGTFLICILNINLKFLNLHIAML